jgi:hypothetical protein
MFPKRHPSLPSGKSMTERLLIDGVAKVLGQNYFYTCLVGLFMQAGMLCISKEFDQRLPKNKASNSRTFIEHVSGYNYKALVGMSQ